MQTVIVGSKNAAKLAAVTTGVQGYWPQAKVRGENVPSGVPDQPLGMEQTVQGAVNRAKAAHALGANLGIGLEGGVVELAERPVLLGIVAVFDGTQVSVSPTVGVPLPDAWGNALKAGEELGPFIVKKFNDYNKTIGTMPFLTHGRILREDAFTTAVIAALAPWVKPEAFAEE
ncbi:MAG: DUF84 family protein [Pseudomonadaceae bacterium]|nr:DUF84 family protein [Pseudomonadaceae bacterium]